MIEYELRKLFFYKYALVIFVLLFALNRALCFLETGEAKKTLPDVRQMVRAYDDYASDRAGFLAYAKEIEAYEQEQKELSLEAMMRDEEYEWPEKQWKYTGKNSTTYYEKLLINGVLEAADKATGYKDAIRAFIKQNKTKLREYKLRGEGKDSYIYRYTEYTIKVYEEYLSKDVGIGFEYVHGWEEFFIYHEGGLFAFAAILVLCCTVMLGDKSSGFYAILSASKKGRGRTLAAKLGLCALLAVLISLLFSLSSLVLFGARLGLSSPLNVIQALPTFTYLPFECTVIGYLFLVLAVRAVVSVFFALVACGLAALLNNYVYSYLAGVGFIGLNLGLYLLNVLNPNGFFKVNNLHSIWSVYPLFNRVRAFEFFGQPFENRILLPLLFILLSGGLIVLTALIYHRTGMVGKSKLIVWSSILLEKLRPKKKRAFKARSDRLLPYELYKLAGSVVILLLIAGTLFGSFYMANKDYEKKISYYEAIYNEYMNDLAGPSSKKTDEYIANEKQRIAAVLAQKDQMRQRYQSGELTTGEFNAYMNDYYDAEGKREVFSTIEEHQKYIKEYEATYGGTLWYLHDVGYEKFFNRAFDIWFYLALLLLFCGIFTVEYKSNNKGGSFYAILQSTKNGRKKSIVSRLLAAAILYLPLWALFTGGEYFFFIKEWGLPELSAPLASLHAFENLASDVTLGSYLTLCALLRLLGGALFVLIVSSFSQFTKKPIPTISSVLILTLAPHALVLLGVNELKIIDFTALIDVHSLVRLSISLQSGAGSGLNGLIIFTIIAVLIASAMFAGAYLSFAKIKLFKERRKMV